MSIICIKHKNGTYPFFDDKYFSTFFSKCQCFFSATIKFFYARKVLNLLAKALQRLLRCCKPSSRFFGNALFRKNLLDLQIYAVGICKARRRLLF